MHGLSLRGDPDRTLLGGCQGRARARLAVGPLRARWPAVSGPAGADRRHARGRHEGKFLPRSPGSVLGQPDPPGYAAVIAAANARRTRRVVRNGREPAVAVINLARKRLGRPGHPREASRGPCVRVSAR